VLIISVEFCENRTKTRKFHFLYIQKVDITSILMYVNEVSMILE